MLWLRGAGVRRDPGLLPLGVREAEEEGGGGVGDHHMGHPLPAPVVGACVTPAGHVLPRAPLLHLHGGGATARDKGGGWGGAGGGPEGPEGRGGRGDQVVA